MRAFADLLERLVLTPSRNRKLELMAHYFSARPDPDRGIALAALTGELDLPGVKPALIRSLVEETTDEVLFRLSYDYVGDLAETAALLWPGPQEPDGEGSPGDLPLREVVGRLATASRAAAPRVVRELLDALGPSERYAMLKLATGALRIGVSARLAKQALADFGKVDVTEIEHLWHGLQPPYLDLFAWLEGRAPKPESAAAAPFRPVMLAHPLEEREQELVQASEYIAEWKWDGIRVQAVSEKGVRRLYSRTGDDISPAFPDIVEAMDFEGALDGELLVGSPTRIIDPDVAGLNMLEEAMLKGTRTFSDLQQRLNRKAVSTRELAEFPAFVRAYDILVDGRDDLRDLPLMARKERLAGFVSRLDPTRFDLSAIIAWRDLEHLASLRAEPPHPVIEGLMLKRRDSPYMPGRPKGPWFKWKREAHLVDAVLMYAQRGHGKRSGFYSDYTFGVWRGEGAEELVPVGKAYSGFTDEELKLLDKYVRDNTVDRFGPVRSVTANARKGLVLEIAFEGLNRSARHKSGVAMRFPRVNRIRWDKPSAEADRLETLEAMLAG